MQYFGPWYRHVGPCDSLTYVMFTLATADVLRDTCTIVFASVGYDSRPYDRSAWHTRGERGRLTVSRVSSVRFPQTLSAGWWFMTVDDDTIVSVDVIETRRARLYSIRRTDLRFNVNNVTRDVRNVWTNQSHLIRFIKLQILFPENHGKQT